MKKFPFIAGLLCTLSVALILITREKTASEPATPALTPVGDVNHLDNPEEVEKNISPEPTRTYSSRVHRRNPQETPEPPPAEPILPPETIALRQTVDLLVSPQTSFQEKQQAWQRLRKEKALDSVISELEHSVTNYPAAAEYPATLGQAYIQKIISGEDMRDQAILGLKADASFEMALKRDPKNWEAGFSRAVAMSHWPEQLNKSSEVIELFSNLIQQQETMPPQPEFADSYVMLGAQYQKAGYPEYAQQTWQRGAALFPTNRTLQKKIAKQP